MKDNVLASATNPPAFPRSYSHDGHNGMTLRDFFAVHVAGGIAAYSGTQGVPFGPGDIANRSYAIADAMLAERSAKGQA